MHKDIKFPGKHLSIIIIIFFLTVESMEFVYSQSLKILKVVQEEDSIKIIYNLTSQREQDRFFVSMEVSKNGGINYVYNPKTLVGDYGYGISRGVNKILYWKPLDDNIELIGDEFVFRLNAFYLGSEPEIQLISFEGGSFEMGDAFNEGEVDEIPVHKVNLDAFEIGKYEVSNFQFAKFLNEYGSDVVKSGEFKGEKIIYPQENGILFSNNMWKSVDGYEYYPVCGVTWYGANEFCKYYGFRLPTEAEWEFAARSGGVLCRYSSITDSINPKFFNYNEGFSFDSLKIPAVLSFLRKESLGSYPPNQSELFQMSGNVWEYCLDWYEWDYYAHSDVDNPTGPFIGQYKVIRGGAYTSSAKGIRVFERSYISPSSYGIDIGFRVARSILRRN